MTHIYELRYSIDGTPVHLGVFTTLTKAQVAADKISKSTGDIYGYADPDAPWEMLSRGRCPAGLWTKQSLHPVGSYRISRIKLDPEV